MATPTPSHVSRYFARVDTYLPTLTDSAARHAFLASETAKWTERYRQFQEKVNSNRNTPSGVTAFDFIQTLAGLSQRSGTACHEQLVAAE